MSTRPPLVSAIVPTYNCAGILPGCLDSLLAQDYPALEVLVVDGGSRDGTAEIARGYGAPVRVRSEPDRGIYDAMNKGIADAGGEWLYFIGADDALADPRVVADVMDSEAARDEGTLMVYGDVISDALSPDYRGEFQAADFFRGNICHQAIFYRRRLFDSEGTYRLEYPLYADWDLNMRAFIGHPGACRYIDRSVARYAGGTSSLGWDREFLIELPRRYREYVRERESFDGTDETLGRLYFQALRAARMKRDSRNLARLLGEIARQPLIGLKVAGNAAEFVRRAKRPL